MNMCGFFALHRKVLPETMGIGCQEDAREFVNEKAWVIDFLKVEGTTVAIESFQGADAM